MKVPFKQRSIPVYAFCGDGLFSTDQIKGIYKRRLRKKQIRKYLKINELE